MAYDPRNVPQVGDEYGNGIVAKAVVTAEGLEITVREAVDAADLPGGESRPVSIPQTVDPDALNNVGADEREEAEQVTVKEQEEVNKRAASAARDSGDEEAKPSEAKAPAAVRDNAQAKNERPANSPSGKASK